MSNRATVITKLAPIELPKNADLITVEVSVRANVLESCRRLRVGALDYLLIHRYSDVDNWNGEVWKALLRLKEEGVIKTLGVSVQSPTELREALEEPELKLVQLPYNIIDDRWGSSVERLKEVKEIRGLEVYVRSVYLQGLLLSDSIALWKRAHVEEPSIFVGWLREMSQLCNRSSLADLCIAYVRAQDWIDGVVVGMEGLEQLRENLTLFSLPSLAPMELEIINKSRPLTKENMVNPTLWNKE